MVFSTTRALLVLVVVFLYHAAAVSINPININPGQGSAPVVLDAIPKNFSVGVLRVFDVQITRKWSPTIVFFSAEAAIDIKDSKGRVLLFDIAGELDLSPWNVAFSGKQNGTWSPYPTSDLQLSFLAISYNGTTGKGAISGGDTIFGDWTVEIDLDFVSMSSPAIGFVVTDANPTLNGLPGAPPHAFDAANSLFDAGLVISSYNGIFQFTSGVKITVQQGTNLFAASVLDGITIRYTGMVHFIGGFSITLTATADNFVLGQGLDVGSAVVTAQFPAQPFFSMNVAANWVGLAFTILGTFSTSGIQFTGNAPGPWQINHGSTPVILSNMLITFNLVYSGQTTGELRGSVQWGSFPMVTGIMKYPADSQALGCFDITVIVGNPGAVGSLNGVVKQAVGNPNAKSSFPSDSHELFDNTLQSVTLSVYPDCGALYVGAVLDTQTFGTVDMEFALFEYAPVSSVLSNWAQGLPDDPPVHIGGSSGYVVGAKEVLQSLADAFYTVTPPILVAEAYIVRQPIVKSLQQVLQTASAMRQQLLVKLTEHEVQLDALTLLQGCVQALQNEDWDAPSSYGNSTWAWFVSMSVTNAHWPLSEPSGVYLSAGSFALASASFHMTVGDGSILAEEGFNFMADITVSQSTLSSLNQFKNIDSCTDKAFQVSGYIGNAQTGWFLQGQLTDGCVSLGANLQLSSTSLRVQSAEPQVSFTTVMTLPQTQDMSFEMDATFSTSNGQNTVLLSGSSQSVYHTNVGKEPLEIDNMNLQMTVTLGKSSSFSASMSGAITLNDTTEISASTSFNSATTALSFSLSIHEDKPVMLFNLLKVLVGEQEYNNIPMPASGKELLFGVYLVQGSLSLSTQPPSLAGSVQVIALYKALVSASLSFNNGQVAFGFSVQTQSGLLQPIKLSDILPNITVVDEFRMRSPVIGIATAPTPLTIPGIEFTFNAQTGFTFEAYLALDDTTPRSTQLTKWLGNNSVVIAGVIDPAAADFQFQAQSKLANVHILDGFDLTAAGFFIQVQLPQLNVGFDATAQIRLAPGTPTPFNTISVTTTFEVGTAGASLQATVTGPWDKPFGVNGLTFLSGSVALTLGNTWGLATFTLTGTAQLGQIQGSVTFINEGLLTETVLAASLQGVSLEQDIMQTICGRSAPNTFTDASMQSITLSVNPTLQQVGNYPPGIAVVATGFTIGTITLQTVEFAIDPILGVIIKVDASSSQTGTVSVGANNLVSLNYWDMELDLMLSSNMGVHVDGQVDLLGVQCSAAIDIDFSNFALAVNFTAGVESIILSGGVGSGNFHVVDFGISGELNLNGYLSSRLLYYAQQTINQKSPEIKQLQADIAYEQGVINGLQQQIAERSANDTAAKQQAEQAVQQAEQAVTNAQNKVNGLNQQIQQAQQNYDHCSSWDFTCKAKYKAEILALQAALDVATAALNAAQAVLQAAMNFLNSLPSPDTDPVILKWKAEVLVDQGIMGTYQTALDADLDLTNFATQVLQEGASALQPKSITFSMNSFIGFKTGQSGNTEIEGSFLGKPLDIGVPMVLNNVEQYVSDVWTQLQKLASQYKS